MDSEKEIKKIIAEMEQMGREACNIAIETITREEYGCEIIHEAINYFAEDLRTNFQHPALLSIACEAAGGNPKETVHVGAALVLLTGAADIHDDIIDKSRKKGSKMTVFGRFGGDITLLIGDILFIEGLTLLSIACENFPKEKGKIIKELIKKGFLEIGAAETLESTLKGKWDIAPEKLLEVIRKKGAVAEATARAGAVIGNATPETIEDWGKIGRILSIVSNIRDEFIDMFEADELTNRRDNECLPLPILYAMRDPKAKKKIIHLLKKGELTDDDARKVVDVVLNADEVQRLKLEMHDLIEQGSTTLDKYKECTKAIALKKLLKLAEMDL